MANLRTNNLSGQGGRNAIKGSVVFGSDETPAGLRIEDNSELELGSETHWTIEFWIFLNGSVHGDYDVVLGKGSGTGNNYEYYIEIMSDNTLDFLTTTAGTAWDFQQQITPVLQHDSWHHIALVRNGSGSNSLKSYVNGQEYGSFTAQNIHTSSYPFGIGYYAGLHAGLSLAGNATLSNLRICKGHAVYTANFEPPRYELKSHYIDFDDKTFLLCCQDSDNPLQEATGKTITGFGRYEYLNDTEIVLNGTFDTDTSDWTTQGDTVEIDNQRLKIIRSGTFGAATQQINARMTQYVQYKFRGRIEQSGSPGSALIRLSSAANGNGTIFFNGAYGTGVHETIFNYNSGGGFYVSAIAGNGNVTGIWDDISVKAHNIGLPPKNIPPSGSDAGNTFNGAISMNSPNYMYFPTGNTEQRVTVNNNFGTRGLVFQGLTYPSAPSRTFLNSIEYITVATKGDATDFGDLISGNNAGAGAGNLTRGIQVSGNVEDGGSNVIQYVTIATTGNATDFGDVGYTLCNSGAVSNQTRLVYSGGESPVSPNPQLNNIEFITFATTGNGVDFGDQMDTVNSPYGVSSPTRGVYMGGSGATPTIQSIQIATTGDSVLFGDLTSALYNVRGTITNVHRGVMAGGVISPTGRVNNIEYITIQSGGQSIDFGDLTDARDPSNLSSMTRGVMFSGDYPANVNIIDFIEIMTTCNALDFGDCNKSSSSSTASNGHGGLADDM